jgi:hypothetical protein
MGLPEALNSPLLVSATGAGALAALPALEQALQTGTISFLTLKLANALLYGVSIYAVQQPGRLDGKKQVALENSPQKNDIFANSRSRTLIFPSGWAFSIWGLIFLGEFLFCSSSFFISASSPVAAVIKKASGGFMVGQIFQTLWTASFRPKYAEGGLVYISSAMLAGIAWSLGRAHAAFASTSSSYGLASYLLCFGPMSLHFGWTMAAALVNLNGNLATPADVSPQLLAGVGHLSVVVATGLGVSLSLLRRAPVVGAVIAWALTACATGLGDRLEAAAATTTKNAKDQSPTAGLYGARFQKWLCASGAVLSAVASVVAALPMRNKE